MYIRLLFLLVEEGLSPVMFIAYVYYFYKLCKQLIDIGSLRFSISLSPLVIFHNGARIPYLTNFNELPFSEFKT